MEREKSALLEDILARLEVIHADLLGERKENFGKQGMSLREAWCRADLREFKNRQQENRDEKIIKRCRLESVQICHYKRVVEKSGIIIATCGECGAVLLLKAGQEKITCHSCLEDQDAKDCPSLW